MRLIGRVLLVGIALLVAIPAGSLFLTLAPVFDPVVGAFTAKIAVSGFSALMDSLADVDDPEPVVRGAFAGLGELTMALLVAPPVFTALVGEVAGLRSPLWHVGGTGAITAAVPWILRSAERPATAEEIHITLALFLTGATAGLMSWLIAGRSAGYRPKGPMEPVRP